MIAVVQQAGDAVEEKKTLPNMSASLKSRAISFQREAAKLMAPKPISTAPRIPSTGASSTLRL